MSTHVAAYSQKPHHRSSPDDSAPEENIMKPIRGPIDYNRYPPRERRATSDAPAVPQAASQAQPDAHGQSSAPGYQNPHLPKRRNANAPHPNAHATIDPINDYSQSPGDATGTRHEPSAPVDYENSERRRGRRVRSRRERAHRAAQMAAQQVSGAQHASGAPMINGTRRVRSGRRRVALWKRARRWAFLLMIALVGEMGVAALTSSHFAIARVEVQGLNITQQSQIAPIQNELLGQNWLRARLSRTRNELEKVPSVSGVELTRMLAWPPQIQIRISERQPFARVGADRNWLVVDREGVPFRAATAEDRKLYAVTGPTLQPHLGRAFSFAAWRPVREAAQALAQSEKEGDRWPLRRLYFDRHGFASLRLQGGAQDETLVQLGADRWPEKLRRARQALDYFEATGRRASTLNLLSYSMPTWTPKIVPQAPQTASQAISQAAPQPLRNESASVTDTATKGRGAARFSRDSPGASNERRKVRKLAPQSAATTDEANVQAMPRVRPRDPESTREPASEAPESDNTLSGAPA